jgi:transposase
MLAALKGKSRK